MILILLSYVSIKCMCTEKKNERIYTKNIKRNILSNGGITSRKFFFIFWDVLNLQQSSHIIFTVIKNKII